MTSGMDQRPAQSSSTSPSQHDHSKHTQSGSSDRMPSDGLQLGATSMGSNRRHESVGHAPIKTDGASSVIRSTEDFVVPRQTKQEFSEAEPYDSETSTSSNNTSKAAQALSTEQHPHSTTQQSEYRLEPFSFSSELDKTISTSTSPGQGPTLAAEKGSGIYTSPSRRHRKTSVPRRSLPSSAMNTMKHQYGYSTEDDYLSSPGHPSPRIVKLAYFSPPPSVQKRKRGIRRVSPSHKSKSPTPTPFTLDQAVGGAYRRALGRSSPASASPKRHRVSSPESSGQEMRPPPGPKKRSVAKPMPTGEGLDQAAASITWKGRPLDISDSPSLHLLIPEEEHMCIVLRVTPEQYLMVKNVMLEKYAERGPFTKSQLRKWVRMDVTKLGKMYDFVANMGWMTASCGLPGRD